MKKIFLTLILFSCIPTSHAMQWENLWARPDQQAEKLLRQGKPAEAADKFDNPDWKATAQYRAGHYEKASQKFGYGSSDAYYNRGNALAHLGQTDKAIASYEKALNLNPEDEDAKFNLELLKKLQEQQQDHNKQQDKQQQSQRQQSEQQKQQPSDNNKDKNKQDQAKNDKQQSTPKSEEQKQREKEQAHNQMLRRVPDDPGGLLKQKFKRDYLKRKQAKW